MGNSTAHSRNPLTRNWHPLAPGLLQHAHTRQLIREHTLTVPSAESRAQLAGELSLRMAQHHPHVAQPIYFRNSEEDCHCSPKREYSLLLYTEHEGSALTDLPHPPTECYCLPIVATLQHLQDLYGSFAVWEGLVFLGQRHDQQGGETLKLWIHSKVESCRRERPCSESEMVHSTLSMLGNLRRSHNCKFAWDSIQLANTMRQLREEMSRPKLSDSRRHRKSNSASVYQPGSRNQTHTSINAENQKKNGKASSMPPRNEERERHNSMHEGTQGKKEVGNINNVRQTTDAKLQIGCFAVGGQELQSKNNPTARINFSYSHHHPPHPPHPIQPLQSTPPPPPTQLLTPIIPQLPIGQTQTNPRHPAPQPISSAPFANNPAVSIVISHSMQSSLSPPVNHPISHIERPPEQSVRQKPQREDEVNFISREMELPILQLKDSPGTAKLPTTSRSPQRLKDHPDPQCHNTYSQPKPQPPSKRSEKSGSVHSSGNKFQKYSQAIKQYQEKLKQRLSVSGKVRQNPPVRPKKVEKVVVTPTADFKETKSVYNDSGDEQESSQKQIQGRESEESWKRLQREEELRRLKKEEQQRWWRVEEQKKAEIQKAAKQAERKRREQMQKIELERDLEKQKKLIQNEMEDLLRHNAMKEQYRSIREKVKQKKETFAQLKAEATKILEDLGY